MPENPLQGAAFQATTSDLSPYTISKNSIYVQLPSLHGTVHHYLNVYHIKLLPLPSLQGTVHRFLKLVVGMGASVDTPMPV